ncbi:FAD/NAD(P)-binding domain-containing protein [Bimuria novae-zelandiae CBS 107.79]|uniref:FAD/NAD(P)-binding domain-containing protein n=1 Tax=Bimuria novae-zelandiae CBS 107.79 TaxID=1447943 RepID=A0A6A5UMD1_9PLEO|nr:FAD/NAD(P)-binding domain-containing protein [Bimuria novae-zelandiae CBS 107.79]
MTAPNGHTCHNGNTPPPLPIVLAGGGCVGLFLALLLAQSPIPNRIIVLEPSPPDPTSTRAMAHQPLIFPLFERSGLMRELSAAGTFSNGLCFRTGVKNGSALIAGKRFAKGERAQLLLPQGKFQSILMGKIRESGKAEVKLGARVVGFAQKDKGGVSVEVRICKGVDGEEEVVEAEYLVGADGAHSTVRKAMGLPFTGETLPNQLVATDIVYDFHLHGFYDANFIIDEEDYGLIGRITEDGLWRVSYGVPNAVSEEEVRRTAESKIRRMLPDGGRGGLEVRRVAPYKAQQLCVEGLWRGRVGIVGDAAHLTNPYAGLGLASGIADAASLASVLIRILTHQATDPEKLLESWSDSRKQKFWGVIDKPSRVAYARVKTKVDTEEEVEALVARDPVIGAMRKGVKPVGPGIETCVEELVGW